MLLPISPSPVFASPVSVCFTCSGAHIEAGCLYAVMVNFVCHLLFSSLSPEGVFLAPPVCITTAPLELQHEALLFLAFGGPQASCAGGVLSMLQGG